MIIEARIDAKNNKRELKRLARDLQEENPTMHIIALENVLVVA